MRARARGAQEPETPTSGRPRNDRRAPDIATYNFAYLDEQTKRMIRRAILKAHRHPRLSGAVRLPRNADALWLGHRRRAGDGRDHRPGRRAEGHRPGRRRHHQRRLDPRLLRTRSPMSRSPRDTAEATIIQTRHRIPEQPLTEGQILVYQVPIPEPLRFLEPRETETRKMHALEEYGLMHVKLYEDIARHGHIATTYAYPVKVEGRYVMDPSPMPKFDNPKMHMSRGAAAVRRRPREAHLRRAALYRGGEPRFRGPSLRDPELRPALRAVRRRAASISTRSILDDQGGRMFVCSDTDHCEDAPRPTAIAATCWPASAGGSTNDRRTASASVTRPVANIYGARIGCARCLLRSLAGRGAGDRRRIRLGQDDAAQLPRRPG